MLKISYSQMPLLWWRLWEKHISGITFVLVVAPGNTLGQRLVHPKDKQPGREGTERWCCEESSDLNIGETKEPLQAHDSTRTRISSSSAPRGQRSLCPGQRNFERE